MPQNCSIHQITSPHKRNKKIGWGGANLLRPKRINRLLFRLPHLIERRQVYRIPVAVQRFGYAL